MKKILALLALGLGVVSCQTEPEGLDVNVGGEVETTVCVSLPEATRANSALGAFENVDWNTYTVRYIMQIFDENGRASDAVYVDYKDGDKGNSVTFPVRLVPNRDYNFVVWADIVTDTNQTDDLHYNLHNGVNGALDLRNITLKGDWNAMDETRDAYTGFHNTEVEGTEYTSNLPINITLTRPFAKLRVLTTDMQALRNLGITPKQVTVNYTVPVYNSFNAYNGAVNSTTKDDQTFTFDLSGDNAKNYEDITTSNSLTLFADYLFGADNNIIKFNLTVKDQNDKDINKTIDFNTDINVKRNYLTTISGNILTEANNVTVTVEENGKFENVDNGNATDHNYTTISSAAEFLAALNSPGEFIVISDLEIANVGDTVSNGQVNRLATRSGSTTIVDLNGHTITVKNTGTEAIATVEAGNTVAFVGEGEIILEQGSRASFINNEGAIDVAYANVVSEVENVEVFAGDNVTNYLDELRKAFAEGGEYTMKYDVVINEPLTLAADKTLTLNLNGKTISHTYECTKSYDMILNKGNLTINGDGKISFTDTSAGDPSYGWGSYTLRNEGTLVVNGGTIEHLGQQEAHMICAIYQYSGESTINGGVISTPAYRSARLWNGNMTINGGNFEGQLWLQAVSDNANLTINGGSFAPRGGDSSSVFVTNSGKNVKFAVNGGYFATKIGMSVPFGCISGGEFTTAAKDATSTDLLADGYQFAQLENGNWTVEFVISTVEQFKAFRDAVDEGNTFAGKTVKLGADIDLNEEDENGEAVAFNPIGDYRSEKTFNGTFDGQGHTIKNLNQNTWALDIGYYYGSGLGLGLFACVNDATIKNLKMDKASISGESAICGIVAATAYGKCTFENITVTNSECADYQYYAGGIVGWASGKHEYINCNVDASTTVATQWGDFDNSTGGVIGGAGGSAEIFMKDCTVACRIDAHNDVVSAYRWYAYRRCGMLIGNTSKTKVVGETTYADAPQLTCENVKVIYGDWANYTYCEFAGTGYPYVRVQAGVSVSAYSNVRYGHPTDANGNTVVDDNHVHNEGEDHDLLLAFDQLYGGGQGVYGTPTHEGVTVVYNNK